MASRQSCRKTVFAILAVAGLSALNILPAAAQTLERIAGAGTINIGFREDSRPFSYVDEAGQPNGFTVELCREIAVDVKSQLGLSDLKVNFVPVTTEDRFQAIVDGRIDLLCGSTTITLSRRELVSFSIPIFQTGISPVMRSDAPRFLRETLGQQTPTLPPRAAVLEAFTDRVFGVRANTTAEDWLRESIDTLATNAELVTVDSYNEGLQKVLAGEIDAFFGDRAILLGLVVVSEDPGQFFVGDRLYTHEPYGLALAKGDEAFRLRVDRTLSQIYRSLEITQIFARHFGRPGRDVLAHFIMNALPE